MIRFGSAGLVLALTACGQPDAAEQANETPISKGYVLKAGEGEDVTIGLIKASPKTGSQGGVMIQQPFPDGFSTGLHIHNRADEFFYVIDGAGKATIGDKEHDVAAGDVIFVPKGAVHGLSAHGSSMELLEFLDKPGLDEDFRAFHASGADPHQTLEERNAQTEQYGTTYLTIE